MAKKTSQDHKAGQQYWVIKTTEGGRRDSKDHWKDFQTEKVIAVGWKYIQDDPTKFGSEQKFKEHLASKHAGQVKNLKEHATNVYKFATELQIGDIVIICRGYAPNQKKDVYLYGFAQIAGEYFRDEDSEWWKNKIKAEIITIERDIPLKIFVGIFGGSMRKTLHGPLEKGEEKIRKFSEEVEKLYPKLWNGLTTSYPIKFADKYKILEDKFSLPEEIDAAEAPNLYEGAVSQISVNAYERNPKARKLCIERYGTRCHICDFDFKEIYGEIGEDFIHVHHLRQLSDIGKEYEIDPVNDLCPVCPNCHSIIHRKKPPYTLEEIRGFLDEQKKRRC